MNGKNKGSAFERKICTELSLWWTEGERSDIFWRSTSSGARATVRGRKGDKTAGQYGDICAIDPIGQPLIDLLVIELKKGYNQCTIADLLDKPEGAAKQGYEKWFEQAEEGRKHADAYSWLLIHKRDRRDGLVFMPGLFWDDVINKIAPVILPISYFDSEDFGEIVGCHLSQWLQMITPKLIRSCLKRSK